MSKLSEISKRETEKAYLQSSSEDYIEFYTDMLFGEVREIDKLQNDDKATDIDVGVKMIMILAKDWTITDDEGKKLPINKENIEKLPSKDINAISKLVTKIVRMNDDKKKDD